MTGTILLVITILFFIFPIAYSFFKKVSNKFLFISAVNGGTFLLGILVGLLILPAVILLNWVLPHLRSQGITDNINWLLESIDLASEYYGFVFVVLYIPLSVVLYRRYEVFREST